MNKPFKQLEIRWVNLDPTKGAETQKKRPCIILQSDMVNSGSMTFIIAPILPDHKNWPFAVNVKPTKRNGLDKNRHINLKQIRSVDISRIENLQGVLEKSYLKPIKESLSIIFDF
jgi:mRNA interferase MazF